MFAAVCRLLAASTLVLATASPASAMPTGTSLSLHPEAGNTVGRELSHPVIWHEGIHGSFSAINRGNEGVAIFFEEGSLTWLFQFSAPGMEALGVGRYGQAGAAGPDPIVSSPFGMLVQWSGWFDVREIAYGDNGSLDRLAVDFRQFDSLDQTGPAVFGSLRYRSSLALAGLPPVAVPEPGTPAMLLLALAMLGAAARGKARQRR